jgi:hypothetical protein
VAEPIVYRLERRRVINSSDPMSSSFHPPRIPRGPGAAKGIPIFSDNPVARRFCRRTPLASISWAWGLSRIAPTTAIYTTGVVVLALLA